MRYAPTIVSESISFDNVVRNKRGTHEGPSSYVSREKILPSECERDTTQIAEVVLIRVGEPVREIGQKIVDFTWSDRYQLCDRDIDAPSHRHRKSIAGR